MQKYQVYAEQAYQNYQQKRSHGRDIVVAVLVLVGFVMLVNGMAQTLAGPAYEQGLTSRAQIYTQAVIILGIIFAPVMLVVLILGFRWRERRDQEDAREAEYRHRENMLKLEIERKQEEQRSLAMQASVLSGERALLEYQQRAYPQTASVEVIHHNERK
jgi:membrane protein implicated in regulation of membrane protease activity